VICAEHSRRLHIVTETKIIVASENLKSEEDFLFKPEICSTVLQSDKFDVVIQAN
jgi:hypothetical protein